MKIFTGSMGRSLSAIFFTGIGLLMWTISPFHSTLIILSALLLYPSIEKFVSKKFDLEFSKSARWIIAIIAMINIIVGLSSLDTNPKELESIKEPYERSARETNVLENEYQETESIRRLDKIIGDESGLKRDYIWSYDQHQYGLTMYLSSDIYRYYARKDRNRGYDIFVSEASDNQFIIALAQHLNDLGKKYGLNKTEIPSFVISFVQSLQYTSDDVTTGYDEFPKYPYETIVDDGGDCEDTSILTSALLEEIGYGTVLISLPGHMAVGVLCSDTQRGYAYEYNGKRYCYLETTGEGWLIGEIPEEYINKEYEIISVSKRPELHVEFNEYTSGFDWWNVYVNVDMTITNVGSDTAKNVQIYTALQTRDENKVWDQIESTEIFDLESENRYTYKINRLKAPLDQDFRVLIRVAGDNTYAEELGGWWTQQDEEQ
ncbi:hypothetical protein HYU22_02880 [Candidatus Woesearchaeota archaeon]|nr:hypothetical protein [Candidatus Woesearchaeota archaeon]